MDYEHCSDNLSAVGLVDAHPFAHPCAKAMHTRVQKGVHPDGLPSVDLPEDPKAFIFQRFRGDADSSWQYGHLTDVSEHTVHINGGTDPGAGFLDDAWEFGKGLWEKTKNVVKKLQNWG